MKTIIAAIMLVAATAQANDYYKAGEFEFGAAATWTTLAPQNFDLSKGTVGVNLSGAKFFGDYIGATVEVGVNDLYNVHSLILDYSYAGVVLRYPIDRFAPYVKVIGGRDFRNAAYSAQAGGGVEFRLTRNWGVFAEGRYQTYIKSHSSDRVVFQSGISIAF